LNYEPTASEIYPQANQQEQVSLNKGLMQNGFPGIFPKAKM